MVGWASDVIHHSSTTKLVLCTDANCSMYTDCQISAKTWKLQTNLPSFESESRLPEIIYLFTLEIQIVYMHLRQQLSIKLDDRTLITCLSRKAFEILVVFIIDASEYLQLLLLMQFLCMHLLSNFSQLLFSYSLTTCLNDYICLERRAVAQFAWKFSERMSCLYCQTKHFILFTLIS